MDFIAIGRSNELTVRELGILLGDVEGGTYEYGANARWLLDHAKTGRLPFSGALLHPVDARVSRTEMARFLREHKPEMLTRSTWWSEPPLDASARMRTVTFSGAAAVGGRYAGGVIHFRGAAPGAKTRAFTGVAYSGQIITDHPFFDRVAFDLGSTQLITPAPALLNHRDPVGVIQQASVGNDIRIAGELFSDLEGPAQAIGDMADRGLPWQMSVGIIPGSVEEAKPGAKVTINGQVFDGPLTVFSNNRVREVSFTPLGADDRTSVTVAA